MCLFLSFIKLIGFDECLVEMMRWREREGERGTEMEKTSEFIVFKNTFPMDCIIAFEVLLFFFLE